MIGAAPDSSQRNKGVEFVFDCWVIIHQQHLKIKLLRL